MFLGIPTSAWIALAAIFSGISALAVVFTVFLAIPQLREVSKAGRFQSTLAFIEKLRTAQGDREYIYCHLPNDADSMDSLSSEEREKAKAVINSLNEIGALLENGMIDKDVFFGLCHTLIIRCWHKLEPFARHEEKRIGGRYGRRIERLASRAKLYHDIKPIHRATKLKISVPGQPTVIVYETTLLHGWRSIPQKIGWKLRLILHRY